jgi:multiple sugar transport system ATP-binding protein
MAVADTVVMLRAGRVVQIATAQSLYDDPADREVARFVGSPEINLLKAFYEPGILGSIRVAGASFAGLKQLRNVLPKAGGPFEIGIRPEHLKLLPPERAPIQARVFDIEPLGLKSMMTVTNEEAEMRLIVDTDVAARYRAGDVVGLDVVDSGLLAFDAASGTRLGRQQ